MRRIEDITVFTDRFKEARQNKTLKCIAVESHISEPLIRQYSSGAKTPGTGHLKKLAAVLGVSPEWLAGETIFRTRSEERFARFKTPDVTAASNSIKLIYQAIEELATVHGYDLNTNTEEDYDGKGIALWLAAEFEHELEKQCALHLKTKEDPHPE